MNIKFEFNNRSPFRLKPIVVVAIVAFFSPTAFAQAVKQRVPSEGEKPRLVAQPRLLHGTDWLAFSRKGDLLVSTNSTTATAVVWDVASGREIKRFTRNTNYAGYVQNKFVVAAFAPDGKKVAVFNVREKEVRIWSITTGALLNKVSVNPPGWKPPESFNLLLNPEQVIRFVVLNKQIIIGYRGEGQLWDLRTGRLIDRKIFAEEAPDPADMLFADDGKFALIWERKQPYVNEKLQVVDTSVSKPIQTLPIGKFENTAAISTDGCLVATADSYSGVIHIWDVPDGKQKGELQGYTNRFVRHVFTEQGLFAISFQPPPSPPSDNRHALTPIKVKVRNENVGAEDVFEARIESKDGVFTGWETDDDRFNGLFNNVVRIGFKFDGWLSGFRMPVAISADGRVVATDMGGKVSIFEIGTGRKVFELPLRDGEKLEKLSPSGKLIVTSRRLEKTPEQQEQDADFITIYDVVSRTEKASFKTYFESMVKYDNDKAPISADEKFVAVILKNNSIGIQALEPGAQPASIKLHPPVNDGATYNALTFSPDGKLLAVATSMFDDDRQASVRLFNLKTGALVAKLPTPPFTIFTLAFSPDSSLLATGSIDTTVRLWDVKSGRQVRRLEGHNYLVSNLQFSPDGRLVLSESYDQTTRLWSVSDGRELCQLLSLTNGDWITVASDGRFETNNPEEIRGLHWVVPSNPFKALPLEIFMRDYYEPRLLARLLECNREGRCPQEFKPIRDLSSLNRTQPRVRITKITLTTSPDVVEVSAEVSDVSSMEQGDPPVRQTSGVYDLRLFRDGQLVGHSTPDEKLQTTFRLHGNTEESLDVWRMATRVELIDGRRTFTIRVKLPTSRPNEQVIFSAYAFNDDRVKSETSYAAYTVPAMIKPTRRRAYVITFGANEYDNPIWNLQFAANDARKMAEIISAKLCGRTEFAEVVEVPLISDSETVGDKTIVRRDATKGNVQTVLSLLAGQTPVGEKVAALENAIGAETLRKVKQAGPDDLILVSFSSHGYADKNGIFYIVTSDIGNDSVKRVTDTLLERSISSDELSLWLRDVDAGEMVIIVDACHAASAVEESGFKPAPMGSRGLGQLAYDKGMRILTATQADNVALENKSIRQGLLTYALLHDGLEGWRADYKPKDRTIFLSEWLEFGADDVPKLFERVRRGERPDGDASPELPRLIFTDGEKDTRELVNAAHKKNQPRPIDTRVQRPALFDFTRQRRDIRLAQQ